jgi:hypothetical protein
MPTWIRQRLTAVMDHIFGGLALVGVLAAIAALAVFGGQSVTIEGWEIVVVAAALLALALGEFVLFRHIRHPVGVSVEARAEPGPHSEFLHRLAALQADLADGPEHISWAVAQIYNMLLLDARKECPTVRFRALQPIQSGGGGYALIDRSSLRTLARQLQAMVESDNPPQRRTDLTLSM